ncbi:tRNA pseudouridine(13) synthase TruD [Marinobacterium sediminicola]|uniref:tRNA pseudouridine synthase D n=1 Tax=Marinobacterium sediminicola TaxID=518898 RepID=A0ABY1S048_9GAMM|nr:tRNA pseudouridine(13) synthase TruD [Marinobacterium sediminicola]ULG69703.1 tRNA pseudouridine(13) synthase TruD [Marinobacterium sediminicola]SMR74569.1 tRNA pseudouridine13 synthase [Marinobacterium sediminicola]
MNLDLACKWLYGEPLSQAMLRSAADDFQVYERLPFEPDGEGEHLFLYIRKTGENTDWVARQLARFCQISPRDVGYAGKKDRHAVTEQWFSVRLPIGRTLNWSLFGGETIEVLKTERHSRKLRLGALSGNRFVIRLRQVSQPDALAARIEKVRLGVPNYFGEQRFGNDGGNLTKGQALLAGTLRERQRHKKGLYISALRSWLFNQVISARIDQQLWSSILPGDVLMLNGTQSCFMADNPSDMMPRLEQGDLHLTGPMWGRGELMTQIDARAFEMAALAPWQSLCEGLEGLGLNQERRSLRLMPQGLKAEAEAEDQWRLEFELPAGAFATSVLRELCQWHNAATEQI